MIDLRNPRMEDFARAGGLDAQQSGVLAIATQPANKAGHEGSFAHKIALLVNRGEIEGLTPAAVELLGSADTIAFAEPDLLAALERIRDIPTKEWSIDTAHSIARAAIAKATGAA